MYELIIIHCYSNGLTSCPQDQLLPHVYCKNLKCVNGVCRYCPVWPFTWLTKFLQAFASGTPYSNTTEVHPDRYIEINFLLEQCFGSCSP